jgi:hypothetical protein
VTYKPKTTLWPHQKKALSKMQGEEGFALLMAMRTGKSPTQLADFGAMELSGVAKDQLVIAPAGVYHTWKTAIADHCSEDLQDRMLIHTWESGMGKGERKKLEGFMRTIDKRRPRTLLMNVEALSRPGEARKLVTEYLDQRSKLTVTAIDESVVIKNHSKRTQFINRFIRPRSHWRRLLSGLATPRSPLDLFYQFEFLDWKILGFRSWYVFRAHIAFMKIQYLGGRSVQVIDKEKGNNGFRPGAIEELHELIEPHSFRVPFRPKVPSTYSIREVELTKEQKKAYNEIKEFATTQLENSAHVTATVVIAQIMRLHQVLCGHVRDEEGNEHEIPELRTAALMELLEDYSGKAVIWCSYDYNVRKISVALKAEYGEESTARFWGGNLKTREQEAKSFLNNPACRFMIATPDAGRFGQTWSNADLAIYFSSKDNLDHRDQSEQRTMGVEKNRGVDNIDLIVADTIEMKILHSLRNKINMATVINGDDWREWLV